AERVEYYEDRCAISDGEYGTRQRYERHQRKNENEGLGVPVVSLEMQADRQRRDTGCDQNESDPRQFHSLGLIMLVVMGPDKSVGTCPREVSLGMSETDSTVLEPCVFSSPAAKSSTPAASPPAFRKPCGC